MTQSLTDFSHRYGPWALVAGASEGLGAAFAEALAQRGLSLVLVARREALLSALAERLIARYQVEIECCVLDLADQDAVLTQLDLLTDREIGLLIYNAAYAPVGTFAERSLTQLMQVVDVNVRGPLLLLHRLLPPMQRRGRGGIVLMSSLAGLQGTPRLATYAASKAFGTILAESLWGECQPLGVDVIASCAGAIRTPGYTSTEQGNEAPGTLDAADVVTQTLDALGHKPRVVPGLLNTIAQLFVGRWLPRSLAIRIMKKNTETLT